MKFNLNNPTKSFQEKLYNNEVNSEIGKIVNDKDKKELTQKINLQNIISSLKYFKGQPIQSTKNYKDMITVLINVTNILFNSKYESFQTYRSNTVNILTELNKFDIKSVMDARNEYEKYKQSIEKKNLLFRTILKFLFQRLKSKKYRDLKTSLKKIDQNLEDTADGYSKILFTLRKKVNLNVNMVDENICVITVYYILDLARGITTSLLGTFIDASDLEFGETRLLKEKQIPVLEKNTIYINDVSDLFPNGNPSVIEIKQGHVGDCYLLSALTALAITNPNAIKSCFLSASNTEVIMVFYKIKVKRSGNKTLYIPDGKMIIKLNASTLLSSCNQSDALWVKFFEKGYAIFRKKGGDPIVAKGRHLSEKTSKRGNESLAQLSGGQSSATMTAITGKPAEYIDRIKSKNKAAFSEKSGEYNEQAIKLYNTISTKLRSGKGVGVSFKSGVKDKNSKRLQTGHAYAITDIGWERNQYIYVTIRNPWGSERFTTRDILKKSVKKPICLK